MSGIDFNGKFLCADRTGVHRVARELLATYCHRASASGHLHAVRIMAPENIELGHRFSGTDVIFGGLCRGRYWRQIWEQVELPWHSRGRILVNLCNLAPISKSLAVTMIHDAQVFTTSGSYAHLFSLWYRAILPIVGRRHQRILTVSNFSKAELVRTGIASADRITVIHNGVDHMLAIEPDTQVIERLGVRKRKYAVALANLQKHKNIPLLLKVFGSPRMSDMTLLLIGDGDRAGFERLGHSVPDNVRFSGKISDPELRALLEGAACTLTPSLTEGFGMLPLEGMILGCPAVVSPCGALPEVCGSAAKCAAPDDADAWIDAIDHIRTDPEDFAVLSQASREHAQRFTWSKAAAKLEAVLEEVRVSVHEDLPVLA